MWRKKNLSNGKYLFLHESPGDKGTIIGVHGLTGHHMQLGHFQKAVEMQYRMITYDLRGRGKSSNADVDTSIDHHVDDLVEFIQSLNVDRPILMGYSMGAYICLKAATRLKNVAGIILLDGAAETDGGQKELILPSLLRLEKTYLSRLDYIDQTRENYEKLGIRWTEYMNKIVNYEIEKVDNHWEHKSDKTLIERDFLSFFDFRIEQVANKIDVPTLLIQATGDLGHRPLFYDFEFYKLKTLLKNINVLKTNANHLTLVFNRQPEIEWQVMHFIEEHVLNASSNSTT